MALTIKDTAVVSIDGSSGTPVVVTPGIVTGSITYTNTINQYGLMNTRWMKNTEGNSTGSLSLTVYGDDTTTSAFATLAGWMLTATITNDSGARTITVQVPDATTGSYEFEGEYNIASFQAADMQTGDGNPTNHTAECTLDGAPAYSIIT